MILKGVQWSIYAEVVASTEGVSVSGLLVEGAAVVGAAVVGAEVVGAAVVGVGLGFGCNRSIALTISSNFPMTTSNFFSIST